MQGLSFNTKDKKKIILGILAVVAIFVWALGLKAPRRTRIRTEMGGEAMAPVSLEIHKKQKLRTAYKTWGRNPFVVTRGLVSGVTGLQLGGIIYDAKECYALINDRIVRVGDEVNGNKVIEIKQDRVILNDGSKDFELRLGQYE